MIVIVLVGWMLCLIGNNYSAYELTPSSDVLTIGSTFTFTCKFQDYTNIIFQSTTLECLITGVHPDGTCNTSGSCNHNFLYSCNGQDKLYNLTIPDTFVNDSYHNTEWKCGNPFGTLSTPVLLLIYVPVSQVTILPVKAVIPNNGNIQFNCTTNGIRPNAQIQWYLSDESNNLTGSAIQQPDCASPCLSLSPSTSTLMFTGNIDDHLKVIYCIASNIPGKSTRSRNASINILYGPNNVTISPATKSYTKTEAKDTLGPITCKADCRPICEMTWNGPSLPDSNTSVLNIQNITRNQSGDYRCTVNNSVGSHTSGKISVIVNYGPNSVDVHPPLKSYMVNETDSLGPIICRADCRPNCTMKWIGPNLPSDVTSILEIQKIHRYQSGDYKCSASNTIGNLTSNYIKVMVKYGPTDVTISPTTTSYTKIEYEETLGPITCRADCRPNCTLTWSGPNQPGSTTSVLNIQNITRNQAGDYRCTANNSVDSRNSSTIVLTVNYVPTIRSVDGNMTFNENDTAIFYCNVDSIPESTLTWKFIDDKTTTEIRKHTDLYYKGIGSFLKVVQMSCLSMGLYRCEANNSIGMDKKDINVTVMCAPRLNTLEHEIPSVITVKDNESLNITAWVLAFPKPNIFWQFIENSTAINITKGITYSSVRNRHVSTLFIQNMRQMDFGFYAIYATNTIMISKRYIGIFDVQAARRPDKPSNVTCSVGYNYVMVNWKPEFDGGSPQHFTVYYKNILESKFTKHQEYVSEADYHPVKVANLQSSRTYLLRVHAINEYNSTVSDEITCNTTTQEAIKTQSLTTVGVGAGLGTAVVVICVVVVVLFVFRRKRTQSSRNDKEPIQRSNEEDEKDKLKDNPLYASSADYVLSQRVISEKALKNREQDKRNKPIELGCIYENHDDFMKKDNQIYANQLGSKKSTTEYKRTKNKDGLIYADLDLAPVLQARRFIIRGVDNQTNYAIIDLKKKADPLPSDDDEEEDECKNSDK